MNNVTFGNTCCVVTISKTSASQGSENKSMSCSGVFLHFQSGFVVCSGIMFSQFLNDTQSIKKGTTKAHPSCLDKNTQIFVDFHHACTKDSCHREAQLLMLTNCSEFQDVFHKIFKGPERWGFYNPTLDTELMEDFRFLTWFALLKTSTSECTCKSVPWIKSDTLRKGCNVIACGSPFAGLCPDLFMNTISKGIVSNLAGEENALILTDARCLPGTEGGAVFVSKGGISYLVGLIVSPLCWKSEEWIGLTLVCSLHLILKNILKSPNIQETLANLAPQSLCNSLQAAFTVNRLSDVEFYPRVALIDTGLFWGSGVLLSHNLVLTCRHVVDHHSEVTAKVSSGERFRSVRGKVLYSSAPLSPYDIAFVELQEPLMGVKPPRFATYFHPGEDVVVVGYGALGSRCGPSITSGVLSRIITHQSHPVMLQTTCAVQSGASGGAVVRFASGEVLGIVSSNTRDYTAKVTYPHLNFCIPVTIFEPLLRLFNKTADPTVFKVLDSAHDDIRKVWRLQNIQSKL